MSDDDGIIAAMAYGLSESMSYVRMGYLKVAAELLRMVVARMKRLQALSLYLRAHELVCAVDRVIWLKQQECRR